MMRKLTLVGAALGAFALAACGGEDAYDSDTDRKESARRDAETADRTTEPAPERTTQTTPAMRSAESTERQDAGEIGEGGAAASQTLTVTVAQSDEYGEYLTDAQGRPLYMFTADTQGGDSREARIACAGACLENWPLATSNAGEPKAGAGVQRSMLGTVEADGETAVTYNGWPLYYFAADSGPGEPQGNEIESFGGQWFLVTPDGSKVGRTQMQ